MKTTERLRRKLAPIEAIEAPDLREHIQWRRDHPDEQGMGPEPRGPRTRLGQAALAIGVVVSVVTAILVLARVFPDAAPEPGPGGTDLVGSIILSVSDVDHVTRLYRVAPDGSGAESVSTLGVTTPASQIDVSQDASRVAFTRAGPGDRGLWVADLDGSAAERLAEGGPNGDSGPAWSPDGSTIVFSRNRVGHAELFVIEADGANLKQLTTNDVGQDFHPAWSPDGLRIAFSRNSGGPIDLWIVDTSGGEPTQLTQFRDQDSGYPSHPSWSPDGERLVFAAASPGAQRAEGAHVTPSDLWVIDADGSNLLQLTTTPNDDLMPRWSPDGSSIVYLESVETDPLRISPRGSYRVALYDMATGATRPLDAPTGGFFDLSLQWLGAGSTHPLPDHTESPPTSISVTPVGDRFVIASGETEEGPWQISVYQAYLNGQTGTAQWCLDLDSAAVEDPNEPATGQANICSLGETPAQAIGPVTHVPDFRGDEALLYGQVSPQVAHLEVTFGDGTETAEIALIPAPVGTELSVGYFATFVADAGR